jgi:carbamoyl-phosphate synthase large subunit
MTLSDTAYQRMRSDAMMMMRALGNFAGGCNVQFAQNPETEELIAVEINPRVSRSSALASKATGYPIAKIAAKLAIGYNLDELKNQITKTTSAFFEPTLDYVILKMPRWNFDKFPGADQRLGLQMKSVGEVMAIGRSFNEALQKACQSQENNRTGLGADMKEWIRTEDIMERLEKVSDDRIYRVKDALRLGVPSKTVQKFTGIDPWFIGQIKSLVKMEDKILRFNVAEDIPYEFFVEIKKNGYSDAQIAWLLRISEKEVTRRRKELGIRRVFKMVDTCAAEFEAFTPYYYSSYEEETEVRPRTKPAVIILGSGPNRIGQGIEFDYSCVHASFTLREAGYETIMINCNPETVSTDYDTSDRLYFEPLTLEDVLEVIHAETQAGPVLGVITQLGGQTPLGLAADLKAAGVTILGTTPEAINLAEERGAFGRVLQEQSLTAPEFGMAASQMEALAIATRIGYPVLVRPSFVLGGRGMEIVYDDASLSGFISRATEITPDHPVLVDRFLDSAIEIDVDALYDGHELFLGGVMEHIEEAGIHSGDSACVLPAMTITSKQIVEIRSATLRIAQGVGVLGLINIQFAIAENVLYVLEANPRASRTVPFVSKATGVPLAKAAARITLGATIAELKVESLLPNTEDGRAKGISVKEAVLPWNRFRRTDGRGVDAVLGPEMRSTGEVMGIAETFGESYAKSQISAFGPLPKSGTVFISLADKDKQSGIEPARALIALGFNLLATAGTADFLAVNDILAHKVRKNSEGSGPMGERTIVELLNGGAVDLVINTPVGRGTRADGWAIRTAAVQRSIPCITTTAGFSAAVEGIKALQQGELSVLPIQEWLKK